MATAARKPIYWDPAAGLQTQLQSTDAIIGACLLKAGVPADGDWTATPPDGALGLDTSAHALYARMGGSWLDVAANRLAKASNLSDLASVAAAITNLGALAVTYAAAPPGSGSHLAGEIVLNNAPAIGGWIGWVCTTAGTPGTWAGFGAIKLTGSAAYSAGNVTALSQVTQVITVTGVKLSEKATTAVLVTWDTVQSAGLAPPYGVVTADDQVTVVIDNFLAATLLTPSGNLLVRAWRIA